MPVKIKHKQLGDIKEVPYEEYYHNISNSHWDVLEIWDVAELYNSISGTEVWQTTLELQDAIEATKKHPNIFRWELSDKNTSLISATAMIGLLKNQLEKNETPEAKEYNKPHNRLSRFLKEKQGFQTVKHAAKKGMIYGGKAIVSLWKFVVLVAATFIGGWLALDHNFVDTITWIKKHIVK